MESGAIHPRSFTADMNDTIQYATKMILNGILYVLYKHLTPMGMAKEELSYLPHATISLLIYTVT